MSRVRIALTILTLSFTSVSAFAQTPAPAAPPPPPPGWNGSFGAGLALTQGNSDTSTINIAHEVTFDSASPYQFRSTGLFIRGDSEGETITNRLALDARLSRKLSDRTSVFAQAQYLSDEFKAIDYLISPTVGVAHHLVKNDRTQFAVDAGVGLITEKNPGLEANTSGALTAGQTFKHKLTPTAELTQRASGLWAMDDFDDALYIFGIGMAANITAQTQLKAELLDTFKNRPPVATVQKNDVAILLSVVYKF
ncbi:MAG: DUF481 domain-containing protein [Acidobacteria bacterium]|nr:DUF481 domain-containing protein [Acidobacteriota bacterium]